MWMAEYNIYIKKHLHLAWMYKSSLSWFCQRIWQVRFLFTNTQSLKCRNFQHFQCWGNLKNKNSLSRIQNMNDNNYFRFLYEERLVLNKFAKLGKDFWPISFLLGILDLHCQCHWQNCKTFTREKGNFTERDEWPQPRLYIYIDSHQDQTVYKVRQSSSATSLSSSPSSSSTSTSSSSPSSSSSPPYPQH